MQTQRFGISLSMALLLVTVWSDAWGGAHHGDHDWEDDDHSYDRARRASERGEILDLAEIYARVATAVPGRVLETELEDEHGHWVYELRILDPQGRLREVALDARTGRLLTGRKDD